MRTAYIGMGANLASHAGPPETTLTAAAVRLESLGRVVARSSLYFTKPVGFRDQPRFVNAVVALETGLAPHALLDALLDLEREFGRDRTSSFQNGPRSLDLDILLIGDLVVGECGLDIPHPRLAERAFVLIPLSEIAPQLVEPKHQKTVSGLLQTLLKNCEGETHAVVPIESDAWRAGARGNAVIPRGCSRAGTDKLDSDR
jgi:2-amino-4-hydroxy-6-hydroxymethyldihydropteridine diphosphokinase